MSALSTIESLLSYAPFQRATGTQAYDEETFRHFLTIERRRAEQSTRAFLLVLVSLKNEGEGGVPMPYALSNALFEGLGRCVREIDFIGWYREGRIVAAVLAQGAEPPHDVDGTVADRVKAELTSRLPRRATGRLNVRVVRLPRGSQC